MEWSVSFGPAMAAGKQVAPPVHSTYTVVYKGAKTRVDRNETFYSDFRRYASEAVITYETEAVSRPGMTQEPAVSDRLTTGQ